MQGGSTLFKGFAKRLQRDVRRLVDARLGLQAGALEARTPSCSSTLGLFAPNDLLIMLSHPVHQWLALSISRAPGAVSAVVAVLPLCLRMP